MDRTILIPEINEPQDGSSLRRNNFLQSRSSTPSAMTRSLSNSPSRCFSDNNSTSPGSQNSPLEEPFELSSYSVIPSLIELETSIADEGFIKIGARTAIDFELSAVEPEKSFSTASSSHTDSERYACYCGKTYQHQKDLKRHARIHGPMNLKCGCCLNSGNNFVGYRTDKFKSHFRNKHDFGASDSFVKCEYKECEGILFSSAESLAIHKGKAHRLRVHHDSHTQKAPSSQRSADSTIRKHELQSTATSPAKRSRKDTTQSSFVNVVSTNSITEPILNEEIEEIPRMDMKHNIGSDSHYDCNMLCGISSSDFTQHTSNIYPIQLEFNSELVDEQVYSLGNIIQDTADTRMPGIDFVTRGLNNNNINMATRDEVVEMNSIEPLHFVAMQANNGFSPIDELLKLSFQTPILDSTSCITYNIRSKTLKLRGNRLAIEDAISRIQAKLQSIGSGWATATNLQREFQSKRKRTQRTQCFLKTQCKSSNVNMGKSSKIFSISKKNHPEALQTWVDYLMPVFSTLLPPFIGSTYNASLVLRGEAVHTATPWVQIETPHSLSRKTQKIVADEIRSICEKNIRNSPGVFFSVGQLTLLATEPGLESSYDEGDYSADVKFSYNQPWDNPGMGASIGFGCSNQVAGSLGGHIEIDGVRYMLITSHVVDHSRMNMEDDAAEYDQKALVSPAMCDLVEDVLEYLEQKGRDIKAAVTSQGSATEGDIVPRDLDGSDVAAWDRIRRLIKDFESGKYPTVIGELEHQNRHDYRKSGCFERILKRPGVRVKMDWAICKATSVVGENRHRYSSNTAAVKANDFSNPGEHSPAPLCHRTADPKPGARVYYVGRASGRRSGVLNDAPMIVSQNGTEYAAWFVLEAGVLDPEEVGGDSGALIIQDEDDSAIGQLYACSKDGKLVFAAVTDIFDDIKEELGAQYVRMPRHPNPTISMAEPTLRPIEFNPTSCIKKLTKPRRHNLKLPSQRMEMEFILNPGLEAVPTAESRLIGPSVHKPSSPSTSSTSSVPTLVQSSSGLSTPPLSPALTPSDGPSTPTTLACRESLLSQHAEADTGTATTVFELQDSIQITIEVITGSSKDLSREIGQQFHKPKVIRPYAADFPHDAPPALLPPRKSSLPTPELPQLGTSNRLSASLSSLEDLGIGKKQKVDHLMPVAV